jgi:nicotinate-nucleotide adenylyltransferase
MGGTFDPIHNGHLAAAQSVSSLFQTDEVLFVPAFAAPHKQSLGMTSAFHRFAMAALATIPFRQFRTSTIEVDTFDRRYSVDTVELLQNTFPGADLIFIAGTDMYREIDTWKDYKGLLQRAHFAVVNRPGFAFREELAPFQVSQREAVAELPKTKTIFYLPFVEQPISSSAIRDNIRHGRDVRSWLPEQVWNYIEKNHLYS